MSAASQYKPKRRFRHELYSLAAVLAVPVAVSLVFPYSALSWRATEETRVERAPCAFASLSAEARDAAIAAARSAIRTTTDEMRSLRTDLSIAAIPDEDLGAISDISWRPRVGVSPIERLAEPILPASSAAPAPRRISRDGDDSLPLQFSREELLETDF